ncbi:hypothetical protein CC2G_005723 [Coprinopsis cinerea AmutBmut pab1-1]|nr:hypothetical protein CC2G_005723 [Coprinopsis cinerea AmutBmut pab1-1]
MDMGNQCFDFASCHCPALHCLPNAVSASRIVLSVGKCIGVGFVHICTKAFVRVFKKPFHLMETSPSPLSPVDRRVSTSGSAPTSSQSLIFLLFSIATST